VFRRLLLSTCVLAAMLLMASASTSSATANSISVTEFPLPSGGAGSLIPGPDGNVWFVHYAYLFPDPGITIAKITPAGTITDFPVICTGGQTVHITSGPDGNLWYTCSYDGIVGRMSLSGSVTPFPLPSGPSGARSHPNGIAAGPDGHLWITEQSDNQILQIATDGTVSNQFPIPTANSQPTDIVLGTDGNLYFIEPYARKIGRITPAGVIAEFAITTSDINLTGIIPGPDGNVWFTESSTCFWPSGCTAYSYIGKIEPNGTVTEEYVNGLHIGSITAGSDGNLWFIVAGFHWAGISAITPDGGNPPIGGYSLTDMGAGHCGFTSMTSGGDGNIWFGVDGCGKANAPPASINTFDPRPRRYYYMPLIYR
jgi:virginiamycin B lyase